MSLHFVRGLKPYTPVELAFAKAKHIKDGSPPLNRYKPGEPRIEMKGHTWVRLSVMAAEAGIPGYLMVTRINALGGLDDIRPAYPAGHFYREDQVRENWKFLGRPVQPRET